MNKAQKLLQNLIIINCVVLMFASILSAREVVIDPNIPNEMYNVITADSTARRDAGEPTYYVLKRGGVYPIQTTIKAVDYDFNLKAEDGEGALPLVVPAPTEDGGYNRFIYFYQSGTFENIHFDMTRPNGAYSDRSLRIYGTDADISFKGCIMNHDRGGFIVIMSDSNDIFIEDCLFGNGNVHNAIGGNGRLLECRSGSVDTMIVTNSTFYNLSDRVVRNMGTEINYLEMNHVTGMNAQSHMGCIQLGKTHKFKYTNNIFVNYCAEGDHPLVNEITSPEKAFYAIAVDTLYDDHDFIINYNNMYIEQNLLDYFASNDSVGVPGVVAPLLASALTNTDATHFSEVLEFVNGPDSIIDFITAIYEDPNATEFPNNWCDKDITTLDFAYSVDSQSYTAGKGGFPLGDLNWFPEKKQEWAGWYPTDVEEQGTAVVEDFKLFQNYPNPFNPSTVIDYTLLKSSNVKLTVYNALGQQVADLVNQKQAAGTYSVNWNALDNQTNPLSAGIYFYKLETESFSQVNKMVLLK